jgi:hypothetical protein
VKIARTHHHRPTVARAGFAGRKFFVRVLLRFRVSRVASFAHRAEDIVGVTLHVWAVGQDVQAGDVWMADLKDNKTLR